jgi:hypothetical protein
LYAFTTLVDKWILFFLDSIETPLIQQVSSLNKSRYPDPFGSRFIDFLECILNCKDITVSIDSEGWCYMKGDYKVYR